MALTCHQALTGGQGHWRQKQEVANPRITELHVAVVGEALKREHTRDVLCVLLFLDGVGGVAGVEAMEPNLDDITESCALTTRLLVDPIPKV